MLKRQVRHAKLPEGPTADLSTRRRALTTAFAVVSEKQPRPGREQQPSGATG